MSDRARLAALAAVLVAAAAAVAIWAPHSADALRDRFDDLGVLGPPLFLCFSIPLVAAFFPGPLAAGAAGLLFGTAGGTAVGLVGGLASATLSFAIARRAGAGAAHRMAGDRLLTLRDRGEARPFVTVLYLRILPFPPFTAVNYAVGLSRIPYPPFAAASIVGMAPRTFAYAALGGSLSDLGSPEALVAIGILVAMGTGALVSVRRSGPGTGSSSPAARSAAQP
jgi:uncharacterized membrane protein YdjX (TVP38/TMEM64 family)